MILDVRTRIETATDETGNANGTERHRTRDPTHPSPYSLPSPRPWELLSPLRLRRLYHPYVPTFNCAGTCAGARPKR